MAGTTISPVMATTLNLPTFLLSVFVVIYLASFVVFAVIRILTGVSIQRMGYLSLKRISFELKDGVKLEIRTLGLLLHRPSFAQPTWVSVVVKDAQVTLDLRKRNEELDKDVPKKQLAGIPEDEEAPKESDARKSALEQLRKLRGLLKKMYSWIQWLQMVDLVFSNTAVNVTDVGSIQIGMMTTMIDTRRKTAERSRVFDHCMELKSEQKPAEWIVAVRSVLFFPEGRDPIELLDHCNFNVYGVLEKDTEGVKDLAFSIKFGRINVPCDELLSCAAKLKSMKQDHKPRSARSKASRVSLTTVMEEMAMPGSRTEKVAEVVMESKEILQSFIRGVKEVQFAIGHLLVTKAVDTIRPSGKPLQVMLSMKELGMDIHRLDQQSPAHRMYFSPGDIAHEALLAAIAISVSLDDGVRQDKILYIPMVTVTSRTTLFSKTIQIVEKSESNRNTNILYANMVITSPAIDLEPRHVPMLVALSKSSRKDRPSPSGEKTRLISRLLPKATVKFSMQEPVVRILLPPADKKSAQLGDMDMLVSSLSSISADLESSHEGDGTSSYTLDSNFRIASHNLYYHASSGERHDLIQTESFELKAQVVASPEVQVVALAELETFSLRLVRPEMVDGIKQLVVQLNRNVKPDKMKPVKRADSVSPLRSVPLWLDHFKIEGTDFSVEVAGVDAEISEHTRGAALQIDTWSVDYRARKGEGKEKDRSSGRRRAASRVLTSEDTRSALKRPPRSSHNPTDNRKVTFHIRGVEAYMVESPESWEQEPFMALPHFDLSLSTSTDREGPTLHVQSHLRSFFFNYSLYRHYTVIVATKVLRETFGAKKSVDQESRLQPLSPKSPTALFPPDRWGEMDYAESPFNEASEFISYDIKVQQIQIKATMPEDPPVMLEIHGLDAGLHRWGFPFLKVKNFRLYAESPNVKQCWARLVSLRSLRVDIRETKKKTVGQLVDERSIDLMADAIRVAIPHQMILYKITDNFINTAKACQQMHHRFKTGTNEYILEKKPEKPKRVPRVTLRTKALLLELEDDPFETELGLIYRVGLSEQKKRLAREAAFEAKVKKMQEYEQFYQPPLSPRSTAERLNGRGRSKSMRSDVSQHSDRPDSAKSRSKSAMPSPRKKANMRYDPDSAAGPSESASVSIEVAWRKLQEHNSTAWIKRMKSAKEYHSSRHREAREVFWGPDEMPFETDESDKILGLPMRPALMAAYFNDVDITIDKPSFPLEQLPQYLYRVGKGLPENTEFALLVPLNIKLEFSEGRVLLRDYPLPFIHVPPMRATQTQRLPAWSLQADFVIAEELRDAESMRHAVVNIVPPNNGPGDLGGGFAIDVMRTVSPVKSYSDIKVAINTDYATRITWCTSYQPAIQDMMMVFETFSKPHVDPSDKTGFWDKIRLILHAQVAMAWEGDGDVQLTLKGSRDPYKITGEGAGFVMCWRGDVTWNIGLSRDPQELVEVESEEYILAVPDFSHHVIDSVESAPVPETKSISSSNSYATGPVFKKVAMKLAGRVRWLVGIMFEQEISFEEDWKQRKRSFKFRPHYDVTLKSPQYAKAPPGEVYDAFRGFRSHHLHLSIAIISPNDRDWSPGGNQPSSYNTIHLTPRFFTHFFSWWNLFSGAMSLPVRQGTLWPGPEKTNKKFGRHLATIKYKLCLSPLFISHIYKHNGKDEDNNDVVEATGLKAKLDAFLLDIHMRREQTLLDSNSTGIKINQAELDFHSADIRAVSAVIAGVTLDDMMKQAHEPPPNLGENIRVAGDLSQFTIPDGDFSWIDMDDFVELDWELPSNKSPVTQIMPLAFTPRFTYFRQTDHSDDNHLSPFGHEPSHTCIMSQNNDPREIQCTLVQARLERVNHQMGKNKEAIDNLAQHIRLNPDDMNLKEKSEELIQQSSILFNKLKFLQAMLRKMSSKLQESEMEKEGHEHYSRDSIDMDMMNGDSDLLEADPPFADYASDFDNRFIVHNMQAKWNNSLRNIILKYIHQVSQRRGFVYYMSRRAVKFILDIVEEQNHSGKAKKSAELRGTAGPSSTPQDDNDDLALESRIQELLDDQNKFVVADEKPVGPRAVDEEAAKLARDDLTADVAEEYVPKNSYHVRLIAPQIQMQSAKNEGAAVLVAAQGMQLKVVSVMDRERLGDEVSGLVQRRFALNLDNTQFFVSHHQDFAPHSMSLHSANRYGAPSGSSWPPWVPLESMFDFLNNPVGFNRVVERTSATLRYDKHNSLRLKYSDQVSDLEKEAGITAKGGPLDVERRTDQVWVDFPRVEASCDSSQYSAMYVIVLDLLLYVEPLEKLRSEKLEKIMLASDFSDLTGAPEMVECLQNRIQQLEEIKTYFQLNAADLDMEGWESRIAVEKDLEGCEEELFFMMKAITTAQRKHEDRGSQSSSVVRWYLSATEIIWHLLREKHDPLMDIRLQKAGYERVDNADGSHFNTVEVEMMRGWNLLPNAAYPEMIAPFLDQTRIVTEIGQTKILRVYWHMLEAIAGIPVMDHFEVNLFPLKIQLEHEIGQKIFQYIFPNVDKATFDDGNFSPFVVSSMKAVPDPVNESESDDDSRSRVDVPYLQMNDASSIRSEETSGLELRLLPTLSLSPDTRRPTSSGSSVRPKTSSGASFFSAFGGASRGPGQKPSSSDALSFRSSRKSLDDSSRSIISVGGGSGGGLFNRRNSNTDKSRRHAQKKSDELSQMMSRASNYMTLAYIKIPSVVLCLSYKGRNDSNLEDIHEFVFRMPMLEYRNKMWSNLDLAMHLKKDIIRALVSHTGAILQNKLLHHRPSKNQPNLHRLAASNGSLGTSSSLLSGQDSDSSSIQLAPSLYDSPLYRPSTSMSRPSTSMSSETSSGSSLAPPFMRRPATSYSNMSAMTMSVDELGDDKHGIFHNTLGRHLTHLSTAARERDGIADESEESFQKKRRMLLGKKVFGGV